MARPWPVDEHHLQKPDSGCSPRPDNKTGFIVGALKRGRKRRRPHGGCQAAQIDPSCTIPRGQREPPSPSSEIMALLMDATGFLGAFLLQDLLVRQKHQVKQVIMHAWAKNEAETLNRVQRTSTAYGI